MIAQWLEAILLLVRLSLFWCLYNNIHNVSHLSREIKVQKNISCVLCWIFFMLRGLHQRFTLKNMCMCIYTEAGHGVLVKDLLYDIKNAIFGRETASNPE